jgi:DNA recombination protein RmuC
MGGHVERLGKALNGAVDNYNKMNRSLETRVMPSARKFEELDVAPTGKSLPQPQDIEARARLPDRSGELDLGDKSPVAAE